MSYLPRLGLRAPNYDKFPSIPVPATHARAVECGWASIGHRIRESASARPNAIVAVECYPGVDVDSVLAALAPAIGATSVFDTRRAHKPTAAIEAMVAPFLGGDDPVFGYLCTTLNMPDFFDAGRIAQEMHGLERFPVGIRLVIGPGAFTAAPGADVKVYADMPRWEGQLRQRRGEADNLGTRNRGLKASLQYKRSFFVDWRVADRLKIETMDKWSFLLDTTTADRPKLITGQAHLAALAAATRRPFRLVPFFDPGPWGGQWMREVCDLADGPPNYAWCFDCVPEENSLLLAFDDSVTVEIPALNLVLRHPRELLGDPVFGRFGPEFPIRFDFLDTMRGGNLSFQVHPNVAFAQRHFGIPYTQDESYYILDAEDGAEVYLGCVDGASPEEMLASLRAAETGETPFDADRFAARFPARRHDHFLIPSGTLHCSGTNTMVLEISATPYIFTFKLWDWDRLGLDGKPRPVNVARGAEVIRWDRDASYARKNLINRFEDLGSGDGWREERTGLHPAEFIETRRHWFRAPTPHHTGGTERGSVNVLNLVEGPEAVVESPDNAFAPFTVHYGETFLVPAAVGPYTVRPLSTSDRELATIKASVRAHSHS